MSAMKSIDSPSAHVDRMRTWAKGAKATAARCKVDGDPYGAELATARSQVYAEAARLTEENDDSEAVATMLKHAGRLQVRTPPILGYDEAGLNYVRARAWQYCAKALDPEAPTVQESWSTAP